MGDEAFEEFVKTLRARDPSFGLSLEDLRDAFRAGQAHESERCADLVLHRVALPSLAEEIRALSRPTPVAPATEPEDQNV